MQHTLARCDTIKINPHRLTLLIRVVTLITDIMAASKNRVQVTNTLKAVQVAFREPCTPSTGRHRGNGASVRALVIRDECFPLLVRHTRGARYRTIRPLCWYDSLKLLRKQSAARLSLSSIQLLSLLHSGDTQLKSLIFDLVGSCASAKVRYLEAICNSPRLAR